VVKHHIVNKFIFEISPPSPTIPSESP